MLNFYTDGACSGNPGPGGWGVYCPELGLKLKGNSGLTTNNKMELQAVIKALQFIEDAPGSIRLHTDSSYALNGINSWMSNWRKNGWKTASGKPVKNQLEWEQIFYLWQKVSDRTTIHHVKGHSGNPGNEMADQLATSFR